MVINCINGIITIALLMAFKEPLIRMYTNIVIVQELVREVWPMIYGFLFLSTFVQVSQAVIKSTGNQGHGALITMSAWWAVGVPLAWYLGLKQDGGLVGVWIGPNVASIVLVIAYVIFILCLDW
jgi:MATE family multidrug resistance protein